VIHAHCDALKPEAWASSISSGTSAVSDTEFYIRKYIFPGGWIPSLAQAIEAMEASGLEVVDVENLRRHYALTLDAWAERFETQWGRDQRHRSQSASMSGSVANGARTSGRAPRCSLEERHTHLFQVVVSKGNLDAMPIR
jgi:cyclopropane-fatty-acyl-phospholipid synthase